MDRRSTCLNKKEWLTLILHSLNQNTVEYRNPKIWIQTRPVLSDSCERLKTRHRNCQKTGCLPRPFFHFRGMIFLPKMVYDCTMRWCDKICVQILGRCLKSGASAKQTCLCENQISVFQYYEKICGLPKRGVQTRSV